MPALQPIQSLKLEVPVKIHRSAISICLLLVTLAGCAAAPSTPTAGGQGTAASAAAPTVATPMPAPAQGPDAPIGPSVAAAPEAAALAQSAHELGYTKKLLDGKTVYYCKSDATLGTRLASTKCYTEDQMSAVVQRSIANRQSVAELEHKTMNQPGGT
jgi:hypothetical protein